MLERMHSSRWCGVLLILLLLELVLSAPQGYNYYNYAQQQRINAQRVQAQRLQAQRIQAQRRYQQINTPTRSAYKKTVSRADMENAKFLGVQNQESEDTSRTYHLLRRKKQLLASNPCFFRSADQSKAEGRFLWDLNVYNYFSNPGVNCGGYGGYGGYGGFNGGYGGFRPNRGLFQNLLGLFLPGGALNPNPVPIRPFQSPTQSSFQSDSTGSSNLPTGVQNDLSIDPSLDGTAPGTSTGNVGSTGSIGNSGAVPPPSLSPGQVVGSVASTVNGIIQQLSGNPPYAG